MQSAVPLKLGAALRLQTRQLHTKVERSGIMQALLGGRIDRPAYCRLLRNLHAIYGALEPALARHAGHPFIACVHPAGLARCRLLADDLDYLHGPDWETACAIMPATTDYVRRLQQCDADAPALLLAHAYVRYLGDLSGGQMLQRVVSRCFALEGSVGTGFYAFGDAGTAAALARRFREGLDAVETDATGIDALVSEAQWGFSQHGCLFRELQPAGIEAPSDA